MNLSNLSCRETVFSSLENALKGLKAAGISNIELQVRDEKTIRDAIETSQKEGINVLTVAGSLECDKVESIEKVKKVSEIIKDYGVKYYFISTKGDEYTKAVATIKETADVVSGYDVTLCMETHPPFCRNAEGMIKIMKDVNHPNVRINFDTANIFYYNKNLDSADELEKVVEYVATVHIKDTDGGYESINFPAIGKGVVRFEKIFNILNSVHFNGPLTIELEGPVVAEKDDNGRTQVLIESVGYLRKLLA